MTESSQVIQAAVHIVSSVTRTVGSQTPSTATLRVLLLQSVTLQTQATEVSQCAVLSSQTSLRSRASHSLHVSVIGSTRAQATATLLLIISDHVDHRITTLSLQAQTQVTTTSGRTSQTTQRLSQESTTSQRWPVCHIVRQTLTT